MYCHWTVTTAAIKSSATQSCLIGDLASTLGRDRYSLNKSFLPRIDCSSLTKHFVQSIVDNRKLTMAEKYQKAVVIVTKKTEQLSKIFLLSKAM